MPLYPFPATSQCPTNGFRELPHEHADVVVVVEVDGEGGRGEMELVHGCRNNRESLSDTIIFTEEQEAAAAAQQGI